MAPRRSRSFLSWLLLVGSLSAVPGRRHRVDLCFHLRVVSVHVTLWIEGALTWSLLIVSPRAALPNVITL